MIINILLTGLFIFMHLLTLANLSSTEVGPGNSSLSRGDYLYYLLKLIYWTWLVVGLFLWSKFYLVLFLLPLPNFLVFYLNLRLYRIFRVLVPFISILVLIWLLFTEIWQVLAL